MQRFKRFQTGKIDILSSGVTLLAGPNNSGKSTLLHALAVWGFCIFVLRRGKGDESVRSGYKGQGYGISDDDFNPINLPDLKHLWHGQKTQFPGEEGYSLSIRVEWDHPNHGLHHLKISLSLTNDRLFVRAEDSSLDDCGALPEIVYLPPVAGLDSKEPFATPALRRSLLGRGLAGSVLRNVLYDLRRANEEERTRLKGTKDKISAGDLRALRESDPWERLRATLRDTFRFDISVREYDETFHTTLQAFTQPLIYEEVSGQYRPNGTKRDLMVEGAGALQWICVYAYAVSPETDILLLDEPDAHLHTNLQNVLIEALDGLVADGRKQVLLATHSREVLLRSPLEKIISFEKTQPRYLICEIDRIRMFSGLGETYDPFIDGVRRVKRILFVENESDFRALSAIAKTLQTPLINLVPYETTDGHKERRNFFQKIERGMPGIRAVSLRDRDTAPLNTVCENSLRDKNDKHSLPNFASRTFRRRELENYALVPTGIARTLGVDIQTIRPWWEECLFLPWSENPPTEHASTVMEGNFKDAISKRLRESGKNMDDFWVQLKPEEIHKDLKELVTQLVSL
jgi:predicted ATPase